MTPERYDRIEQLCHQAMKRPAQERAAFLQAACAGDEALRREVESLLPAYDQPGSFLETPPADIAAEMLRSEETQSAPRRTLAHYQVRSLLDRGGMGEVYLAEDLRLGRPVAIKLLARHLIRDETAKARFLREARAASKLDHPSIATVHDIGEQDGELFMVMTLYEGETLKKRLERGALPVEEALGVLRQVAQGLEAAHRAGIVHRDIKPANVLVTSAGTAKILDFGLAKLISDSQGQTMTQAGQVMGTPLYMSPEQLRGEPADSRSDLWSLGVLAYELLSAVSPFQTESSQATVSRILNDEPPSLMTVPGVPGWLAELVSQLLRKNPAERPQSATEVLGRLEDAARGSSSMLATRQMTPREPARRWPQLMLIVPAVLAVITALALGSWFFVRQSRIRRAHARLAEIAQLVDRGQWMTAFQLTRKVERLLGDDPVLARVKRGFCAPVTIQTAPPGAKVYFKGYADLRGNWELLGTSPVEALLPLVQLRLRATKTGFEELEAAVEIGRNTIELRLEPTGSLPAEMVRVQRGGISLGRADPVQLPDYLIDKYEVTNRDFKKFIDSGGYRNPEYWREPLVKDGVVLTWEAARNLFRDTTGRPGPSTWEAGSYPPGQEDYPVNGISWYEAAAYATFAGKSLPTVYHWYHAAATGRFSEILQFSNFSGTGPASVGSYPGMGRFGTYDMAGNVKEWCWNGIGARRYILGGAWNEPVYMFTDQDARPPFDRSSSNGFRCIKSLDANAIPPALMAPIESIVRDYKREQPVSDEIFRIYESLYSYDRTPLNSVVESVDNSAEHWTTERITYSAAYGGERIIAHLYLPKNVSPPYQAIVYFPPSSARQLRSMLSSDMLLMDFVIKSGRALLYPEYKGMLERHVNASGQSALRDLVIAWSKDLGRSIDYLEERADIDRTKLGFWGVSLGGEMGAVMLAMNNRLKVSALYGGGLVQRVLPGEIDPINFAPRVTLPVLMLNGKYDFEDPVETSQEPLFRLLGTPAKDKRHLLYETGHALQAVHTAYVKETLDWFDRYLGPVR